MYSVICKKVFLKKIEFTFDEKIKKNFNVMTHYNQVFHRDTSFVEKGTGCQQKPLLIKKNTSIDKLLSREFFSISLNKKTFTTGPYHYMNMK